MQTLVSEGCAQVEDSLVLDLQNVITTHPNLQL